MVSEWRIKVPSGDVVVTLREDGSVYIEGPAGPEIVTIWKSADAFADELVWHGVDRTTALRTFAELDAKRPKA